jgi:hypothetical protein
MLVILTVVYLALFAMQTEHNYQKNWVNFAYKKG